MMERIRTLRHDRRALVAQGEGPIMLAEVGSRLLLHIVPLAMLSESIQVDIGAAGQLQHEFEPLGTEGHSARFNLEGLLVYRGGEACFGYTQVFRNGLVEAAKERIVVQREGLPRTIPARL